MHEFELISKHFLDLSKNNIGSLNLNDDVFFDKSKQLVVSVDTYVEGVHFINFKKPELVIKKIFRSSISDIICKGVKPKYYFISGSGNNKSFSMSNLKKISKSLKQEQKKFKVFLSGGDTVWSNKLSFTITSVGFSKKIIYRNRAKINDDIYVTGTLGDSFAGLKILKKKIVTNKTLKNYFVNKYYKPNICLEITNKIFSFANSSIDISDGLITDLEKLINKQKLSYKLNLNSIPISKNLKKLFISKKLNKISFISQGDDYQILFTADPSKSRIIAKTAKSLSIKISKIGKICISSQESEIIDQKGKKIALKNKGFYHIFKS
jgi:thiamine-monophosphate kinase